MKKIIFLFSIILLFIGCEKYDKMSDAYGNFECQELILSSETMGILQDFTLSEGDSLAKNELIAVIDTTEMDLQKQELEIKLSHLNIQYAKVESDREVVAIELNKAIRDVDKNTILYEVGAIPFETLENFQYKHDILEKQYTGSRLNLTSIDSEKKQLKVNIQQINREITKCYIKSPISGTVLTKFVQAGELVTMGKPILKMANLSDTYLKAYVTETQLSSFKLNQVVTVLYDGEDGLREIEGRISFISSKAEFTPKTIQTRDERTNLVYAIKIEVDYEQGIKIGMPAEVIFASK